MDSRSGTYQSEGLDEWRENRAEYLRAGCLSGVTIVQVARLLGHRDAGFTLRGRISVMPSDLPSAVGLA